jgi:hypothetical protein
MGSTLQWKAHTDSLLMKLYAACYGLRALKTDHVTTGISYGLFFLFPPNYVLWHNFFWGASPHSINVFRLQKQKSIKTLRTNTNIREKELCWNLFSTLKILTLQAQYIFSLLCFFSNNKDIYIYIIPYKG